MSTRERPRPREALDWPAHCPSDAQLLRRMPPILRAAIEALGVSRALHMLKAHGGAPVYMPIKKSALGLDEDEYERLKIKFEPFLNASRYITLPKADKILLSHRNDLFAADMDAMTLAQLAKKYDLTTRRALMLRTELRARKGGGHSRVVSQGDLFADL